VIEHQTFVAAVYQHRDILRERKPQVFRAFDWLRSEKKRKYVDFFARSIHHIVRRRPEPWWLVFDRLIYKSGKPFLNPDGSHTERARKLLQAKHVYTLRKPLKLVTNQACFRHLGKIGK